MTWLLTQALEQLPSLDKLLRPAELDGVGGLEPPDPAD
jgi:hypothetical protein